MQTLNSGNIMTESCKCTLCCIETVLDVHKAFVSNALTDITSCYASLIICYTDNKNTILSL